MEEEEAEDVDGDLYYYTPIGESESRQFTLLLKVAIANWIFLAICITYIFLA